LTNQQTVTFLNNTFGPYTTSKDTGDVYFTVRKKLSDTIHYRIKWGNDSIGLRTVPLGTAIGVVVHFLYEKAGNDSTIIVDSDGTIQYVFQPQDATTYPEWSDSINFKHEEW
jgi:hypothetical protein